MTKEQETIENQLCEDGAEPNRYKIFAKLREMWCKVKEPILIGGEEQNRSSAALSRYLDVSKQAVTQWATGSGGKSPAPWHVIMKLCKDLGLGVALEPKGAKLYRLTE